VYWQQCTRAGAVRSRSIWPEPIKKWPAPAEIYIKHKKIIFTVTFFKYKIDMSTIVYLFLSKKNYWYENSMEYKRNRSRSQLIFVSRVRAGTDYFFCRSRLKFNRLRNTDRQPTDRVGHCVLLHSERIVLLHCFKEHNVLLRSFFVFLVIYETQKNDAFISVQLQWT